jgi:hypothetical protein
MMYSIKLCIITEDGKLSVCVVQLLTKQESIEYSASLYDEHISRPGSMIVKWGQLDRILPDADAATE